MEILPPNKWLELDTAGAYSKLVALGSKEAKKLKSPHAPAVFRSFSVGVLTARDEVAYDFNKETLTTRIETFVESYNAEVDRYKRTKKLGKKIDVDKFVSKNLKWTDRLKKALVAGKYADTSPERYRRSLWRPFCKKWLYFDRLLNERVYLTPEMFPTEATEGKNLVICCTSHLQMPFSCIATNCLPNEAVGGRNGQCLPLYAFSEDGLKSDGNITDWGLERFRAQYQDQEITRLDIFNYVYAMLHHPLYRAHFAQNLRHGIPRVPMIDAFRECVVIGKELIDLHVGYETGERYDLTWSEHEKVPYSTRVTGRMQLDAAAGTIVVNPSLTLGGIPPATFNYVLGTRSALEWVVDQFRMEQDDDGTVTSDPNRPDDEEYIVQLIERVTNVSLKTVELTSRLPSDVGFSTVSGEAELATAD